MAASGPNILYQARPSSRSVASPRLAARGSGDVGRKELRSVYVGEEIEEAPPALLEIFDQHRAGCCPIALPQLIAAGADVGLKKRHASDRYNRALRMRDRRHNWIDVL